MASLPDQPTQPPLIASDAECGVESGWDLEFGRTHYCALESNHEGDHFPIMKPGYLVRRVLGSEPEPPRAHCWRCHVLYPAEELCEGICEGCNDDEVEQAGAYRESRRLM